MKIREYLYRSLRVGPGILAAASLLPGLLGCNEDPGVLPPVVESIMQVTAPGGLLVTSHEQYLAGNAVVKKQVQELLSDADRLLDDEPESVMNKTFMPPSGDKHDYYSMGPYWWPNPDTPDGLPYIRKDGQVNPESRDGTFDFVRLDNTCSSIHTLSMAYWFTEDDVYRNKAIELLDVWFVRESTRMNPNLKYGQAVPGSNDGRPAGIIEGTQFLGVVDGIFLLEYHEPLSAELKQAVTDWFGDFWNWLQTDELGIEAGLSSNNHGTWYGVQICAFGLLAAQDDVVKSYIEDKALMQVGLHVLPDGTQPEELRRTKSLNYSLMNLRGHLYVAQMGALLGVDMFNYQDKPLKLGLEYIINNLPPKGEWPHEQIVEIKSTHYNDLAQMITSYNYSPMTTQAIGGAKALAVDMEDWDWLRFGGKPE